MNDPQARLSEAPPSDVLQALVGTVVAERYQVEALLGSGGMGAVYRAKHLHMQKTVALKVLHRAMASVREVVSRFEREAVAAARVDHPNIAAATDFGSLADGSFYLIMEFVDGTNLRTVLESGPLPLARVLKIGRQIASALAAAHALGIVHRDLKPDNVMLVDRPNDPDYVKVLDLGIAKLTAESSEGGPALTRVGMVLGTPQYMAPEQAAGSAVDHRADLYALGVILYEMLSGAPPFSGSDVMSLLVKQLTEPAPALPDSVPASWSALVLQLLEKEPAARPQSATEVLSRLDALDTTKAETAAPAVTIETAAISPVLNSMRTHRVAIAACAAATLLLIGTLLFGGGEKETAKSETSNSADSRTGAAQPAPAQPARDIPASDRRTRAGELPTVTPSSDSKPADTKDIQTKGSDAEAKSATAPSARTDSARTTKARSTPKRKTEKRRTGPGGIYIPPPNQWFK